MSRRPPTHVALSAGSTLPSTQPAVRPSQGGASCVHLALSAMKATPESKRWAIVHDMKHGLSTQQISSRCGVSPKACRHWISRYRATGGVQERQRSGRRRVLSEAARQAALDMLLANQVGGAKAVAMELQSTGNTARLVSKQTIIRAVRSTAEEQGMPPLRALRGKPAKQLSAATMQCQPEDHLGLSNVHRQEEVCFQLPWQQGAPCHLGAGQRQAARKRCQPCVSRQRLRWIHTLGHDQAAHCGWHHWSQDSPPQSEGQHGQKHHSQ